MKTKQPPDSTNQTLIPWSSCWFQEAAADSMKQPLFPRIIFWFHGAAADSRKQTLIPWNRLWSHEAASDSMDSMKQSLIPWSSLCDSSYNFSSALDSDSRFFFLPLNFLKNFLNPLGLFSSSSLVDDFSLSFGDFFAPESTESLLRDFSSKTGEGLIRCFAACLSRLCFIYNWDVLIAPRLENPVGGGPWTFGTDFAEAEIPRSLDPLSDPAPLPRADFFWFKFTGYKL